jgi:hypothetical protein
MEDQSLQVASHHELLEVDQVEGKVGGAVRLLEHVVAVREQVLTEDHPSRLALQQVLASAYQTNGQVKEAVLLLEHVVAIRGRVLAEDNPDRLASQGVLASAYRANGQVKQAVALLEHVVEAEQNVLTEDHPDRSKPPGVIQIPQITLKEDPQDRRLPLVAEHIQKTGFPFSIFDSHSEHQNACRPDEGLDEFQMDHHPLFDHTTQHSKSKVSARESLPERRLETGKVGTKDWQSSHRDGSEDLAQRSTQAFENVQLRKPPNIPTLEEGFLESSRMALQSLETSDVRAGPSTAIPGYVAPVTAIIGTVVAGTAVANAVETRKSGISRRAIEQEDLETRPIERRLMLEEAERKREEDGRKVQEEKRAIDKSKLDRLKARLEIRHLQTTARSVSKGTGSSPPGSPGDLGADFVPVLGLRDLFDRGGCRETAPLVEEHSPLDSEHLQGIRAADVFQSTCMTDREDRMSSDDSITPSVELHHNSISEHIEGHPASETADEQISPLQSLEGRFRRLRCSVADHISEELGSSTRTVTTTRNDSMSRAEATHLQQPIDAIAMVHLSTGRSATLPVTTGITEEDYPSGTNIYTEPEQLPIAERMSGRAQGFFYKRENACNLWGILR